MQLILIDDDSGRLRLYEGSRFYDYIPRSEWNVWLGDPYPARTALYFMWATRKSVKKVLEAKEIAEATKEFSNDE